MRSRALRRDSSSVFFVPHDGAIIQLNQRRIISRLVALALCHPATKTRTQEVSWLVKVSLVKDLKTSKKA